MTTIVDHVLYNELPSLEDANIFREGPAINAIINGPIRDVFLKHVMHVTHCLYLQHRHHYIRDQEAVVKVEGTAHLMDAQAMKDIYSFGNKIVPTTWMSAKDEVVPMEFGVVPNGNSLPNLSAEFIIDFIAVLAANNVEGLFGIDTLAKDAWSEMKIGDASVVVPSNDSDDYNKAKFIPVAFAFDDDKPKYQVHGKCGKDHKHSSKPKGR